MRIVLILFGLMLAPKSFGWSLSGSGELPRPILFVHGINTDMGTWGVSRAEKICDVPTVIKTPNGWQVFEGTFTVTCGDGTSHIDNMYCQAGAVNNARYCNGGGTNNVLSPKYTIQINLPGSIKVEGFAPAYLTPAWSYSGNVNGKMRYIWSWFNSSLSYVGETLNVTYVHSATYAGYFYIDIDPVKLSQTVQTDWTNKSYASTDMSWKNGFVQKYGPTTTSPPAFIASQYHFQATALTYYASNVNAGINHNGLEFYTSTIPNTTDDPKNDTPMPFCRIDWTNGTVTTSGIAEIGQTNQVYDRMAAVLTEYYASNWKTDPSAMIDIVCHSQGCLATRNAIATYRSASLDNPVNHINNIVSLTSPAIGTAMATDGSGVAVIQQLRDVTKAMQKYIQPMKLMFYANVPYTSIGISYPLITLDPFQTIRDMLNDFNYGATFLGYPNNYSYPGWQPAASVQAKAPLTTSPNTFMSNLLNAGYPTRPYNNSSIPMTAYYGQVPGIAKKFNDALYTKASDLCHTSLIPFWSGSPVDVNSVTWWSSIGFSTCMDWVNYVFNNVSPVLLQMDAQWSPYSDFVVDVSSQKYQGFFNPTFRPFKILPLIPRPGDVGVPHQTLPWVGVNGSDLPGATNQVDEIYAALIHPPKMIGMPLLSP